MRRTKLVTWAVVSVVAVAAVGITLFGLTSARSDDSPAASGVGSTHAPRNNSTRPGGFPPPGRCGNLTGNATGNQTTGVPPPPPTNSTGNATVPPPRGAPPGCCGNMTGNATGNSSMGPPPSPPPPLPPPTRTNATVATVVKGT
jgi:hypothetical protein